MKLIRVDARPLMSFVYYEQVHSTCCGLHNRRVCGAIAGGSGSGVAKYGTTIDRHSVELNFAHHHQALVLFLDATNQVLAVHGMQTHTRGVNDPIKHWQLIPWASFRPEFHSISREICHCYQMMTLLYNTESLIPPFMRFHKRIPSLSPILIKPVVPSLNFS